MKTNARTLIKNSSIHAILRYLRLHAKKILLDYVFLMVNVKFLTIKIMIARITINLRVNNHNHNVCLKMELVNWI